MIRSLHIQGYRSLRDVTWTPSQLNVIVGPTGAGKSNLLGALALLRQAARGDLADALFAEGGLGQTLWDGRSRELGWSLTLGATAEQAELTTYALDLRQLGTPNAYAIDRELLHDGPSTPAPELLKDSSLFLRRANEHAVVALDTNEGAAGKIDVTNEDVVLAMGEGRLFHSRIQTLRDAMADWAFYHDLRADRNAESRETAVTRSDKRLAPDGHNLIAVLHALYTRENGFKRDLDLAMRAAFGNDFEELAFAPAGDQRIQLKLRWHSLQNPQSAADLSRGTLRFLMLLAILANPSPGPFIALDEPEAGLHPSLLPIVADLIRQAADRSQVVLTTHSSQLLDAFTDEPPAITVVHRQGSETKLSMLDPQELKRGCKEFSLGALFRSGELEVMPS